MRGGRFENIDALRGLAALLVIWLHASEVFVTLPGVAARGTAWYDAADLLGVGRMGVVAFFAISGYVIVPTVRGPRVAGTVDFVIKRCFRLFPPFWLAIAVASVTVWWLFDRHLTVPIVMANLVMLPLEFGEPQMMGHFWTLEVELIFYGLVLILFWSRRLHREPFLAWSLVLIQIAWAVAFKSVLGRAIVDHNLVWSFLGYFICVMFWGAMLRSRHGRPSVDASRGSTSWRRVWPFWLVTALVFGRPLLAIAFGSPTVHREDWRGTLLGLILFWVTTHVPARSARPFVWLGSISYSLYLLHPAVFYPLFHLAAKSPQFASAPLWSFIAASMLASIIAASLAFRYVEQPSNAAARRWVARRHEASHESRAAAEDPGG